MRRNRSWMIAIIPSLFGIVAAFLLQGGPLPNPLLSISADMGTLVLLLGLGVTGVALGLASVHALDQRELTRRLVEKQEQANTARMTFLRNLDHELKNPLQRIQNGLINLAGTSSDEERMEAFARVRAAAERLGTLVAGLRRLVILEEEALEWSSVDVSELLELAVQERCQQPQADNRQLILTVPKAPWPLPKVQGDPDLLYSAISNLLDNALKFTRPSDTIEVRASDNGSAVVIEVADTGLGVPDDEIPHLFEELFRSREAQGIPGSGLGLTLVKAIVEKHGGTASVRSRAGQGTVFTLSLPTKPDSSPFGP